MEVPLEPLTNTRNTATSTRIPIKRILVAIDGSESADNAMRIAGLVSQKYSAEIDLIHVGLERSNQATNEDREPDRAMQVNVSTSRDESKVVSIRDPSDEILTLRLKILRDKKIKSDAISILSNEALAGEEIVKQCNIGEYDLVALGSRGLGRARSFFLGSVSKKVASEVKLSVLISKTSTDLIKRILLAYDGSDGSKSALRIVADLAKKFNAIVNVISVISEPMLTAEIDVRAAVERLDKEMKYYGDQAKSTLAELGVTCENSKVVGSEKISNAISKEAEEGLYDIVAMGTRGWGKARTMLLGSVAMGVLDSSKANVLVVK